MNEFASSLSSLQPSPSHEQISRRAQEPWARYGQPVGRDEEIWLEAERSLTAESRPPPARAAAPAPGRRGNAVATPRMRTSGRASRPNP